MAQPLEDELDLHLLAKMASGAGGQRTGALKRKGFLEWRVTPAGHAALEQPAPPTDVVAESYARTYADRFRRSVEDADCEHGAFMCSTCADKMLERLIAEAVRNGRADLEAKNTWLKELLEANKLGDPAVAPIEGELPVNWGDWQVRPAANPVPATQERLDKLAHQAHHRVQRGQIDYVILGDKMIVVSKARQGNDVRRFLCRIEKWNYAIAPALPDKEIV